jgi:hypothetical protein
MPTDTTNNPWIVFIVLTSCLGKPERRLARLNANEKLLKIKASLPLPSENCFLMEA